jgi:hypothetical protein
MTVNAALGIESPLWIAIVAPYTTGVLLGAGIILPSRLIVRENAALIEKSQRFGFRFFRALVRSQSGRRVSLNILHGTEAASRSTANS